MKEESKHGGKRKGAGRKTKLDEEKANALFVRALREKFKKQEDDQGQHSCIDYAVNRHG